MQTVSQAIIVFDITKIVTLISSNNIQSSKGEAKKYCSHRWVESLCHLGLCSVELGSLVGFTLLQEMKPFHMDIKMSFLVSGGIAKQKQ